MEKGKKYKIDMCSGSVIMKMLIFALPLMCSSILQLLFNAADMVVVGRFAGDNALAAVGSNSALIKLLTNLFIGLSTGTNVLVAQYYGGKKWQELKETLHTSMLLSIYSGLFLTVVGIIAARQILIWIQAPLEVLDLAAVYLRLYFIGMTSTMVYNFGSAILRAFGDTKRPLYYLLGAGVVNVVLNLIFAVAFRMGVAGVAAATVISQTISALLVVRCLILEKGDIHLELKELRIHKERLLEILQIGLPAGFQGIVFALSKVVIQSAVNSFGAIVVAGDSAASNIEGFVYMAINAFYQATISFTSQNYGAKQYKRIDKILFVGELYAMITSMVLGYLAVHFGEELLGIYSSSKEVIRAGMIRLKIVGITYALCGGMDILVGALRGIGYSVLPMIVTMVGACGLRLLWLATVFQMPAYHSLTTIYMSYPITWAITLFVHMLCFLWARRRISADS